MGKLLGPRGNSLKRLQEETGAKMSILGKGSMRDKAKVLNFEFDISDIQEVTCTTGGQIYKHISGVRPSFPIKFTFSDHSVTLSDVSSIFIKINYQLFFQNNLILYFYSL